jgi:hypothetical protein
VRPSTSKASGVRVGLTPAVQDLLAPHLLMDFAALVTSRSPQQATILSCCRFDSAGIAMPDFLFEFLGRLAVMLPVILILVVVLWLVFNRRRHNTFVPAFSPSDMRTWSLRFALVDGAVFGLTFALLSAWMADSQFSAGVAGGLAALVAMGLVPWLATRFTKLSNK